MEDTVHFFRLIIFSLRYTCWANLSWTTLFILLLLFTLKFLDQQNIRLRFPTKEEDDNEAILTSKTIEIEDKGNDDKMIPA